MEHKREREGFLYFRGLNQRLRRSTKQIRSLNEKSDAILQVYLFSRAFYQMIIPCDSDKCIPAEIRYVGHADFATV